MNKAVPFLKTELLAPAGSMEKLETALAYGAHAVYMGGPFMNLRGKNAGFSREELEKAVAKAHEAGVKAYICFNALPRESLFSQAKEALEQVACFSQYAMPDALIVADPGVLLLAQEILAHIPVHLSTQANTVNAKAIAFWQKHGVSRINLARELCVRDIQAIIKAVPDMDLELFVHGAQCMAISGRCMLSAHLNTRSANEGVCTHPCRFEYRTTQYTHAVVEEGSREGEGTWEVVEEEGYSTFFATEDLCLIKYIPFAVRQGMKALKIEGRMKSGGYLAHVVDTYATGLAHLQKGNFQPGLYLKELHNTASRPLGTGFFLSQKRQVLYKTNEKQQPVLARIIKKLGEDSYLMAVRHRFYASRSFAIMVPGLSRPVVKAGTYAIEKTDGTKLFVVHSGQTAVLRCQALPLAEHLFLRAVG